jgi:glutamine cyclotransferase
LLIALFASSLSASGTSILGYKVVATLPHSTDSYTEGLFYLDGMFYEGTGLNGHSALLVIDPVTGRINQRVGLAPQYFGEGIVDWGPDVYQWTWKSHVCFVYDRFSLRLLKTLTYNGEGWGMTRTRRELITSDGTSTLTFRNPRTFQAIRKITVRDGDRKIDQLNELEFIKGVIYANIWHSDLIAKISPVDGHVIAWIDLTGLLPASERRSPEAVLNGIAYDARGDRIFVTGKQWPTVFQIQITPR